MHVYFYCPEQSKHTVSDFHNFDFDRFLKPCKNKILVKSFCTTYIGPLRNHYYKSKLVSKSLYPILNEKFDSHSYVSYCVLPGQYTVLDKT